MVISAQLSSALRKKPLWPGFAMWYKFMNALPYDTKLAVENVIISHHHIDHLGGFNPLVSTSYAFLGDQTVACDILDRDAGGRVAPPAVFWDGRAMERLARDNMASRYFMWGNAAQFGNGLPKELAVFEFINLPSVSEDLHLVTVGTDRLRAPTKASMFVADANLTETDKQNILTQFNLLRTSLSLQGPPNESTLLYDVKWGEHFDDGGRSSLTLDDALRDHPITGEPIRLRDDVRYMKRFIESHSFSAAGLPASPSIVPVAGTMEEPFVIEANEKRFSLFSADGESGSDLVTEWEDVMLEPLAAVDDSEPLHLVNIRPRAVASPERTVRVMHLADNFYPLYPNMEAMRVGPRNVFAWVDLLGAIAVRMDDDTVLLSGHGTGYGKLARAKGGGSGDSDRMMLYKYAEGLKAVELCAVQHINEGRSKVEAIETCRRNVALPETLFEGYGSISAHVDAVYKLLVGSWKFDTMKALVRETSAEAISLLVGALGADTVLSMARDIKLRADCGEVALYTLALELVDMVMDEREEPTPERLLLKAELLAALYRMETNPTTASVLLLDLQRVSEDLAAFEGYEAYLLSDRTYAADEDHPLDVKPFFVTITEALYGDGEDE